MEKHFHHNETKKTNAVLKIIVVTNVGDFIQHNKGNISLKKTINASTARQQATQCLTVKINVFAKIIKEKTVF